MENVSIQIQTIIYHNDPKDLEKAICNIDNAIAVYRREKGNLNCVICYGDASREPIFSEEDIECFREKYKELEMIHYVFFNENTGTSKGHNRLARNCKRDYIMVMNPDVLVTPRFFLEMLEPFKDKRVGLTEARQTPIEHPKDYDTKTFETSWSTGACFITPAFLYEKIHGFDEGSFFMYCDDVDLSWRIRMEGYKLIYRPRAAVYHAKRLSESGGWQPTAAERYYSAEAALMMAHKWSQKERLQRLLWDFSRSNDENLIKAAKEFKHRQKSKTLAAPLDKDHKVATFIDGEYAKHRFTI